MKKQFLPFIRHMSMAMLLSCCTLIASSQNKAETLTNKTIIDLSKAGLSNDLIISKVNASPAKFDLSASGLVDLKKQGVKDDVIAAMMDKENGSTVTAIQNAVSGAEDLKAINHVYGIINGKLQPLERLHAESILRLKAFGYGGNSQVFNIDGTSSPVRIRKADARFRINTGGDAPELGLYKCKVKGNKRQAEGLRTNAIQARTTGKDLVAFNITQLKDGVFELTPEKPLESGEYFFIGKQLASASRVEAFAFGVD